jgi:hypothetical protein
VPAGRGADARRPPGRWTPRLAAHDLAQKNLSIVDAVPDALVMVVPLVIGNRRFNQSRRHVIELRRPASAVAVEAALVHLNLRAVCGYDTRSPRTCLGALHGRCTTAATSLARSTAALPTTARRCPARACASRPAQARSSS